MKKSLVSLLLCLLPLCSFIILAKKSDGANIIYLHKQQKEARSSLSHLKTFSDKGNVVLKFYADWCGPCKRMAPLVKQCARTMTDIMFININYDYFSDLARTFSVTSVPTLIFLHNGKEIGRYDGGPLTQEKLDQLVHKMFKNY